VPSAAGGGGDEAGAAGAELTGDLRTRAEWMLARVEGDDPAAAGRLVLELRNAREYALMLRLAEAIGRKRPADATNRRLYAQALIEQGQVMAAIDVLERLAARLKPAHPEHKEATGLLGRAHKQIFFDTRDKGGPAARDALTRAIEVYRKPFERDPGSTWHGVNLVALLARARREGIEVRGGLKTKDVARQVMKALDKVPVARRDEWYQATRAEAALGLGDEAQTHGALRSYVGSLDAKAFMIASTLRQFTQLWGLGDDAKGDPQGAELVAMLRARLLEVSEGEVRLTPEALTQARKLPKPAKSRLEAVLGEHGTNTWTWWRTGLDRAAAVCVVRSKMGVRLGTGWLVRAGDLNRQPADELLVMTNFHVVNKEGLHDGVTPENAELVFEAVDAQKVHTVGELLWQSPPEHHDVALLRLSSPVQGIAPLPLAKRLPLVEAAARVYVIGYPGGRSLAFSLQDNALIDHEGPPNGKPPIEGVCRVHYRAPTEGGSSGSPVFNASNWEVIALHHKGGKGEDSMPMLNGKPGTYAANEGVSLQSIVAAMAR